MQNQIQIFENKEFGKLEVLMLNGKPHFPATECAVLLGYKRPHDAISRHCAHSVKHGVCVNAANQFGVAGGKVVEKTYIPDHRNFRGGAKRGQLRRGTDRW